MRQRNHLADYLVYVAIRLLIALVQIVRIETAYRWADSLARLLFRVDARHRKVALENLEHAYGDSLTSRQREAMVLETYRHFCRVLMEIIHIPRMLSYENYPRFIKLKNHEAVIDHLLRGRPTMLLAGHHGNWEMAGYFVGALGFPVFSIARALDNPHADAYLRRFRERTGQKTIPKKGGYDQMLEVLTRGQTLGIVADQDAGQNGQFVEFFGRPASTHKAIALLAIEYSAAMFIAYARRIGPGFRYEVGISGAIRPEDWAGQRHEVQYITQRFTNLLETAVRESPEQYFWLHRRWKHQPRQRTRKADTPRAQGAAGPHAPASSEGQAGIALDDPSGAASVAL